MHLAQKGRAMSQHLVYGFDELDTASARCGGEEFGGSPSTLPVKYWSDADTD
ncbi:MAG: hypothetical protein BMS9Abin12_0795 [Acidimicrobiia bacterium]|nr:MAG: hypothetical protein BMS9Abin12_0795 [Acidimicrobiia bacterium]